MRAELTCPDGLVKARNSNLRMQLTFLFHPVLPTLPLRRSNLCNWHMGSFTQNNRFILKSNKLGMHAEEEHICKQLRIEEALSHRIVVPHWLASSRAGQHNIHLRWASMFADIT